MSDDGEMSTSSDCALDVDGILYATGEWIDAHPVESGAMVAHAHKYLDLGDSTLADGVYCRLQRTVLMHHGTGVSGLHVQVIGVARHMRRRGHATMLLRGLERVCAARGLAYVRVQSVMNVPMHAVMAKLGDYERCAFDQASYTHWIDNKEDDD